MCHFENKYAVNYLQIVSNYLTRMKQSWGHSLITNLLARISLKSSKVFWNWVFQFELFFFWICNNLLLSFLNHRLHNRWQIWGILRTVWGIYERNHTTVVIELTRWTERCNCNYLHDITLRHYSSRHSPITVKWNQ